VLDGVPAEAAEAARDTLGGALVVATQLPDFGAALLATARAAFTSGLRVTAIASAFIVAGIAVLVLVALRASPGDLAPRPAAEGIERLD
jgi:DHA2 family multidrug resistance protein-like MFS transporter